MTRFLALLQVIFLWWTGSKDSQYLYNTKMLPTIPYSITPLAALDFIRSLVSTTGRSLTEVEIMLLIGMQLKPVSFKYVADNIYHVSDVHVAKILRYLKRDEFLETSACEVCGEHYVLTQKAKDLIKSVDMNRS